VKGAITPADRIRLVEVTSLPLIVGSKKMIA
jgi:hypothetical protein